MDGYPRGVRGVGGYFGGTDRALLRQIGPRNVGATSTPAAISFMGFSIPIVRLRGIILRKGAGKGLSIPRIGLWGTR
jgi:hypothetical protein